MKRVIFFARVGNLSEKPYGGGEVGNRRTIRMLQDIGYNVELVHRYYNYKPKSLFVYAQMFIGDVVSLLHLLIKLLFGKRSDVVVHIPGFTGPYMLFEALSVVLSKMMGYKVIYEIRGGGIIDEYHSRSRFYKWCFRKAVKSADCVFSQGLENQNLIENSGAQRFFYYPNCVDEDFMPSKCPIKEKGSVKLVFLGRLMPLKNVDVVLKCLKLIQEKTPATLDIIGDGEDFPDYVKNLKEYANLNLEGSCIFHGKQGKDKIKELLTKADFFIFPSSEPREGQSNSLTETMSFGVIPIASPQGYTPGILGDNQLIVHSLNPQDYANRIIQIVNEHQIDYYSEKMYTRIKDNFTYPQIKERVAKIMKDVLK